VRICFFNRSYWPDQAATGQLLTELAGDLVDRYGHEVTVVAGRPLMAADGHAAPGRRALVTRERHEGVDILRANGTRMRPRRFAARAANYVSYVGAASIAGLRVGRQDVVVSLTDPPVVGLTALWTARRAGARFVYLCEDIFPEVAVLLEDFHSATLNASLDRMNRYLFRRADAIVALGDRMRRRLVEEKGADPARVHVIHNWADCEAIVPGPKDNPFARANLLVDRFVVMHSGNVGLAQNLEVLIEAADRLRSRERLIFAVVGDGSKRTALEAMAAARGLSNVRFFPYQPKALLHDSFAAADAFVVSLKSGLEGFIVPSKVYGILAAGRPYIAATDASAEPAVIARDAGCGLVAAPGDAAALADAIVAMHDNPAETREMGLRARRAARQFDRRAAVQAYHALFERVAGIERAA
jgi:putative colanic acid biosynthesis glycosyltransferase WcaI